MAVTETPFDNRQVSDDRPSRSKSCETLLLFHRKLGSPRINVKLVGHAQCVHVAFPPVLLVFKVGMETRECYLV